MLSERTALPIQASRAGRNSLCFVPGRCWKPGRSPPNGTRQGDTEIHEERSTFQYPSTHIYMSLMGTPVSLRSPLRLSVGDSLVSAGHEKSSIRDNNLQHPKECVSPPPPPPTFPASVYLSITSRTTPMPVHSARIYIYTSAPPDPSVIGKNSAADSSIEGRGRKV